MKILVLVHSDLVPPHKVRSQKQWREAHWKTEYDVIKGLRESGFDVRVLGINHDLEVLRKAIDEYQPKIVFNLLEEFAGEAVFDQNIVSYLEMKGIAYTGSNPRGLILARDKALAKTIVMAEGIRTAPFWVFKKNKKVKVPKEIEFPCFVKTQLEEASVGIDENSIVHNKIQLKQRVEYLHKNFEADVMVESYIEGREFYVGIVGNARLHVYPVWELFIDRAPKGMPFIASSKVKWDFDFRRKHGIHTGPAENLTDKQSQEMQSISRIAYKALNLSGYARIDLRMNEKEEIFFLEANPNPDIGYQEDLSSSAESDGDTYQDLLSKIVRLGINWKAS
ncbi:MAG: ATP-grasp domain-containing protein [Bdellovibrionales bacterium]|nr:ATP-grasp domain-containing protein [Bdellovibrionales bacterium]